METLNQGALEAAASTALVPGYDRQKLKPGILHFGLGAFHRAHQAVYTENALNHSGGDWGIIGVSMRSDSVARQLQPQDLLYSVLSEDGDLRSLQVVGALRDVIVAPSEPDKLIAAMASPDIRILTLTITEKGYCLGGDGFSLDLNNTGIQADLGNPGRPRTAPGILALGLRQRYAAGGAGLTVLSCDNLSENSARLKCVLRDYLQETGPEVIPWLDTQVSFPSSMVDRIVPAMSEAAREKQAVLLGLRDEAAVATEPFSQWIIEDDFAAGRPDWVSAGVQFVDDIRPFEALKLRLLNASHSAIAYLGLLAEKETVADVMAEPALAEFVHRLMDEALIPVLDVPPGFDVGRYRDQLLQRFANSCLHHRCAQIAMDGSEKIRQRWLPTLREQEMPHPLLLKALAAWCYFVLGTRLPLEDGRAEQLTAIRTSGEPLEKRLSAILALAAITPGEIPHYQRLEKCLLREFHTLSESGVDALLR